MLERIYPAGAPAPRGPYSPAVRAGDFIYVAGQGPIDPVTNEMSFGDIAHETRVTLDNVRLILEAAGATLDDVVRCGVYLKYGEDFQAMNAVYREYFPAPFPTRSTIGSGLANPAFVVEIEAIALRDA